MRHTHTIIRQRHSGTTARVRELVLGLLIYEYGTRLNPASDQEVNICIAIRTWQELALAIYQHEEFYGLASSDVILVNGLLKGLIKVPDPMLLLEEVRVRVLLTYKKGRYPNSPGFVKKSRTSIMAAASLDEAKLRALRDRILRFIVQRGDHGATRAEVVSAVTNHEI